MRDDACVSFLRWCLPRLGLRWAGFRKVRRQVCKRIERRVRALGLDDLDGYRRRLETDADEWRVLDGLCRVTISRFFRDRRVCELLIDPVLPRLAAAARARGAGRLACFSAGCASGEEAYTLSILWRLGPGARFPGLDLSVIATDTEPKLLERARAGRYAAGSLRDVPADWRDEAFERDGTLWVLRPAFRRDIRFRLQDIREAMPPGPFDLVFCRNLAFTYFAPDLQRRVLDGLADRLRTGGVLVLGGHEHLPATERLTPVADHPALWRRIDAQRP